MLLFVGPFPLSILRCDSTKVKADSTKPLVGLPHGVRAKFEEINNRIAAIAAARGEQL